AGLFAWLAATVVLCAARGGAAIGFQTGKLSHVSVRSTAQSLTLFAGLSAILWSGAVGWMLAVGSDNQVMVEVCITLASVSMTIAPPPPIRRWSIRLASVGVNSNRPATRSNASAAPIR